MNARTPTQTPSGDEREDAPSPSVTWSRLGRLAPGLITVVLCVIATYLVPHPWVADNARPWKPGDPAPFWNLVGRPFEAEAEAEAERRAREADDFAREALDNANPPPARERKPEEIVELAEGDTLPPYEPQPGDDDPPKQSIELFGGHELDGFLDAVAHADAGVAGSVAHVIHWGDSSIGMDGIPGSIRKRMQARFGDAGHGFHLVTPPNTSYLHREVKFRTNGEWDQCFIINNCKKDGRYGLGGSTAFGYAGAESRFSMNPKYGDPGLSRIEIWYSGEPRGGRFKYRVDDGEWSEVDTELPAPAEGDAKPAPEDRWETIELDEGPHELRIRVSGGGRVRMFGVTLERDVPGLVWDSAALVGAFTKRLGNFDAEHLRTQLEHREADLAVLTFGGNDMIRERMTMEQYEKEYRAVLKLVREARPEMSCLVMAPLDHGVRKGVRIESLPVVPEMVEAQRRAAKAEGCAFFDTYAAMGGEGSAGRWYRSDPRLMGGDLGHATAKGHVVIGEMLYRAILEQYVAYRERSAAEASGRSGTAKPAPRPHQ